MAFWSRIFSRRPLCRHHKGIGFGDGGLRYGEFRFVATEVFGCHLGWEGRVHPIEQDTLSCNLCGETFKGKRGYVPASLQKVKRDERDWPLNPDGTRMKIAEL